LSCYIDLCNGYAQGERKTFREETVVLTTLITAAAAASEPAGGAALDQVAIATAGAMVASGVLLYLVIGHRWGRVPILGRLAAFSERVSGLPGWAGVPLGLAMVALLTALFGMYWDISLHIDNGRDAGPLANPAHYFILAGLFGIFAAGVLAIGLPVDERPGPAAVRITEGWYAPVGGVLIAACGAFSLIAFPLDDFWHRLFGQDVTLWGPTHLMLIGGAGMTLVGQAILLAEGMRARRAKAASGGEPAYSSGASPALVVIVRRVSLMGGFLIGLSTFQAEFDFGVPQFDQIFQPILIALAAGVALTAARVWVGPGGALGAVLFYFVVRGGVSLIVGPVLGETTPAVPLYFAEAACIELAGLAFARRPLALGAVGGVLIGTVGFAAEYGWTQVVYRLPWNDSLLPEGVVAAALAGVAGGLVGALLAMGLRGDLPSPAIARAIPAGALAVLAALLVYGLTTTVPAHTSATVRLTDAPGPGGREVNATVRFHPASLPDDARWVAATSWQGGDLHVERLKRVSAGVYRTTAPIPVYGDWKTTLRVHRNREVIAVPIYMPRDTAIPAPEIPAKAQFTRPFVDDKKLLQREKKDDVPGWLWSGANAAVMALYVAFLTALAIGVGRVARRDPRRRGPEEPTKVPAQPPVTTPPAAPIGA
jgi:hypothetical protein